ncbi:hypothetical protein [Roseobacter litoralis]|uniref:hypothetical protein n=1 Tax=Roseobacter litoralis TaxID=42443 RepID=UPI00249030C4|nr:hypothetical protein [Roseobacter litoralis]
MRSVKLIAFLLTLMSAGLSAQASTLDFRFTFSDGTDTIVGVIAGLKDNSVSAAEQIRITSNTAGFGLGTYSSTISGPAPIFFTVENTMLVKGSFYLFGDGHGIIGLYISLDKTAGNNVQTAQLTNLSGVETTRSDHINVSLASVPLPASSLLMLSVLLGCGVAFKRGRNRKS